MNYDHAQHEQTQQTQIVNYCCCIFDIRSANTKKNNSITDSS